MIRQRLLSTASVLAVMTAATGRFASAGEGVPLLASQDLPAVSALNGRVGSYGGDWGGLGNYGATASLATPLGKSFGFQVDGLVGSGDRALVDGTAAHLFWRDPSRGMIGAYASYLNWNASSTYSAAYPVDGVYNINGAQVGEAGLEGELYFNRFTFKGLGAYQFGSLSGFAGEASLAYYPIDNLKLDASLSQMRGPGELGSLGVEWAPPSDLGLSLFARVGVSDDHDAQALAGIQIYFGEQGHTLIQRQREDGLDSDLPENLFQIIGGGYCPVGTIAISGFCDGVI